MKSHARVVVIGGGIGGCSTLYHLVQEGWTDVVLVERDELTSGTTWHSAAQCPNVAPNQLLVGLRSYTIALYKELAEDPDYPINYHHAVGGMRLIQDQAQMDACLHVISLAKCMSVDFEIISPQQAKQHNPLLNTDGIIGALWDPLDGDIDPAQLCQALARRCRNAGAQIYRHNPVIGLTHKPNKEWIVHTQNGDITCEYIVNACGYRVNEIGKMIDVEYPVVSMEHMYFVTEAIAELESLEARVAMVRCPVDTFYMRQEKNGLLVGVYEYDCKTFGLDGIDPSFTNALCPDDLDRCLPKLEAVFKRLPCLKEVGIQSVINGPITYAADAGPLIGKLPGVANAYSMNGLRVGIGEGGGYGKMLAQIMVHGEAQWDIWQFDPRRITAHANQEYTALKAIEDYQHEFQWHKPHEHRSAGRPAKTTPLYELLKDQGAEFTVVNGWERVAYFKPEPGFIEDHSFRIPNWQDVVAGEVKGLTNGVGMFELCGFNRYEITGAGCAEWLAGLTCSRMPKDPGKIGLAYFLTEKGNVLIDASLAMIATDHFWYGSAAAAEYHDRDWLLEHLPGDNDGDSGIKIQSLTNDITALVVAGPNSRKLLETVSPRINWSREAFPWMSVQSCFIGHTQCMAMKVSFSGELAWELHIPNQQLLAAYTALRVAGDADKSLGLTQFGNYAVESMRLEKGYAHWKSDLITEFNPMESGLERFVDMDKTFVGETGLQAQLNLGLKKKRVLLQIESNKVVPQPQDAVMVDNQVIGTITSAAWGHRVNKNLAMAFIDPELSEPGSQLKVLILGDLIDAMVCEPCLYDPENRIVRN